MTTSGPKSPAVSVSPESPDFVLELGSQKIKSDVFDKIKDDAGFGHLITSEFDQDSCHAFLQPQYSADLLHDAYQSYLWDAKRLKENMPNSCSPDHFKLSGYLAYWLRRNSPIVGWKNINKADEQITEGAKRFREFIFEYGRVYYPFLLGYRICWFFEYNKKDMDLRLPQPVTQDYINTVCYLMKYKSVSPHSLGLIYRSLFFV